MHKSLRVGYLDTLFVDFEEIYEVFRRIEETIELSLATLRLLKPDRQ
ncbi:MAG: hypothetical protein ABH865_09470 [Candidatus Omnitrophota bacterium]